MSAVPLIRKTKALEWLAAFLLYLLLREWLLPLPELTDTNDVSQFLILVGITLFTGLLIQWRTVFFGINLIAMLWLLHGMYFVTPFLDLKWIRELLTRLDRDMPLLLSREWMEMSSMTRTFLFEGLLLVLVSVVSFLVLKQRRGLWFVFLSAAYLATLDTFMPYDADQAIVKVLAIGFLLLAVLHFSSISQLTRLRGRSRSLLWRSLTAPVLIISLTIGVAYAGPKEGAAWPDPVPFLLGNDDEGIGGKGIKKIGYGYNDESLGGPFIQDDKLVFTALTDKMFYWRGESKDFYTGKGWMKQSDEFLGVEPGRYEWQNMMFQGVETEPVTVNLAFASSMRYPTIFYPGQLKTVVSTDPGDIALLYDKQSQGVEARKKSKGLEYPTEQKVYSDLYQAPKVKLAQYAVTAELPVLSEKQISALPQEYPSEIKQKYLQLPSSLPERVRALARDITKNAKTPYDKVRAVEYHLRSSGKYKYEIKDVPVPEEGQDFVDQFLFESKRGYCDHFSTSMVVLLRSVGVPSRWVKGFSEGTRVERGGNGRMLVEVRNNNAHSWVEVYFPEIGWIPFEATTTFLSPLRVKYDRNQQEQTTGDVPAFNPANPNEQVDNRLNRLEGVSVGSGSSSSFSWKWMAVLAALLLLGIFAVWRNRRKWMIWLLLRQMRTHGDKLDEKYGTLLLLYERMFVPRKEGETLREYIQRLHLSEETRRDLWFVTLVYERISFGYKSVELKIRQAALSVMDRLTQQLKS